MTAGTIFKSEVATKTSFPVMAREASTAARSKVLGRRWRANLPRLRRTSRQSVTVSTIKSFAPPMLCMAEGITKRSGVG
jgi:hypothetical protein